MQHPADISIEEYNYNLPERKIAKYPLGERDSSKLLSFANGDPIELSFRDLPNILPVDSLLLFNETKVIQARMKFQKTSGAKIEIFCLEPVEPVNDFQLAFQQSSPVVWKCMIGNAKRWKSGKLSNGFIVNGKSVLLNAEIKKRLTDSWLVEFSWNDKDLKFHEIIEQNGLTPLPPYLNREAEESDKERYQTVYAQFDGSVAAPTAGLHFTDSILKQLSIKGIDTAKLTLHVGAGTFKPVSSEKIKDHEMHTERIIVPVETLKKIRDNIPKQIIPVGTTSMRTLESLFWIALKLEQNNFSMAVEQWDPYEMKVPEDMDAMKAVNIIINYLSENKLDSLNAETRLMIAPGYRFRFAKGLITNFHQPKSTLLLLVSALIGDKWKTAYDFAMENNFRFLSYGDSCLFMA
ncbi:MAG: S-adenosylmethionine:tRNA ribosyltransferase-isomerase [Chlorobi bacterium]|nr:S-adenosylmethionine:tRNA ribosyltransferase-isomerase [Chlorobiota bacterium]